MRKQQSHILRLTNSRNVISSHNQEDFDSNECGDIFLHIIVIVDKSNFDNVVGGGNGANFLPLFLNGGERRSDGASCGNLLARVTLELFRRKLGAKNQPTELQGMGHLSPNLILDFLKNLKL